MATAKRLKIGIGITGASGAIYTKVLLQQLAGLSAQWAQVGLIWSSNAKDVWQYELEGTPLPTAYTEWARDDFFAPIASGSAGYDALIICPCSMGTLGRIANGISNDLITRAADVMLKEQQRLIIVPRETPYNLIHINNMKTLAKAGASIIPASPSFYSKPKSFEDLAATVTTRVLRLAGFEVEGYRWGENG